MLAAIVAPLVWMAPGQWPQWYALLWVAAVGALVADASAAATGSSAAASVAALGATTVVWGATSRGRVELAERDVRGLDAPDAYAVGARGPARGAAAGRYAAAHRAGAARALRAVGSRARRAIPSRSRRGRATGRSRASARRRSTSRGTPCGSPRSRRSAATPVESAFRVGAYGVRVVAVPMRGGALTILVAPRTRLIGSDAYARWYGLSSGRGERAAVHGAGRRRSARAARVDQAGAARAPSCTATGRCEGPKGAARAHVEVDLRGLDSLIPRGGLLAAGRPRGGRRSCGCSPRRRTAASGAGCGCGVGACAAIARDSRSRCSSSSSCRRRRSRSGAGSSSSTTRSSRAACS